MATKRPVVMDTPCQTLPDSSEPSSQPGLGLGLKRHEQTVTSFITAQGCIPRGHEAPSKCLPQKTQARQRTDALFQPHLKMHPVSRPLREPNFYKRQLATPGGVTWTHPPCADFHSPTLLSPTTPPCLLHLHVKRHPLCPPLYKVVFMLDPSPCGNTYS